MRRLALRRRLVDRPQRSRELGALPQRVQHLNVEWQHGVEPAIDLALLGRYYERIGDHAVSMARRVVYLVTGQGQLT